MAETAEDGDRDSSSVLLPALTRTARGRDWPSARRVGESAALLLAPIVVFIAWHVRAMPRTRMIDPFFYGAYAIDGPDLLQRFGPGNYFWPRVGFILPDRLFVTLFGPVTGFFSFRYVLALVATVPLYVLFKQVIGGRAAWLAVGAVLTAPVILTAWGSDYPDSSAVSYLIAGAACLFITSPSRTRRWLWLSAAGVFLGLAVNSQIVAVFVVAGILTGRVLSSWTDGLARIAKDLMLVLGATLAATAILVICSQLTTGHWDIFRPTAHAILMYRQPAEIALFHSSTWRWLIDDIYVLLPPTLVTAWLVSGWPVRRRPDISRAELGFAIATAVAFTLHVLAQFVGSNWTLEYYLYTSMLWATVCPLLVFTVLRVARAWDRGEYGRWGITLAAAAILGLPLIARAFRDELQLDFRVALALVAIPSVGALLARRAKGSLAARACGTLCVGGAATLLVVGAPINPIIAPGQVPYFTPDYGSVLFGDGQSDVDQYRLFSSLHSVVPTWNELPGGLATWWPASSSNALVVSTAQYLYIFEALPATMPKLDYPTYAALIIRRPRVLVLLSDTGSEFDAAQQAVARVGFAVRIYRNATLVAGPDVLHVRVLSLTLSKS